jgi:hypothetical protein
VKRDCQHESNGKTVISGLPSDRPPRKNGSFSTPGPLAKPFRTIGAAVRGAKSDQRPVGIWAAIAAFPASVMRNCSAPPGPSCRSIQPCLSWRSFRRPRDLEPLAAAAGDILLIGERLARDIGNFRHARRHYFPLPFGRSTRSSRNSSGPLVSRRRHWARSSGWVDNLIDRLCGELQSAQPPIGFADGPRWLLSR